jgi:hypothetical protein
LRRISGPATLINPTWRCFMMKGFWRRALGDLSRERQFQYPCQIRGSLQRYGMSKGSHFRPPTFSWRCWRSTASNHTTYAPMRTQFSPTPWLWEAHLWIRHVFHIFQYFYKIKKETNDRVVYNCGSVTFMLQIKRIFSVMSTQEFVRYWNIRWFYHKDMEASDRTVDLLIHQLCRWTKGKLVWDPRSHSVSQSWSYGS